MKESKGIVCPVCGGRNITHYESHYECDECGKQWTQVGGKRSDAP